MGNCRPKKEQIQRTISLTYSPFGGTGTGAPLNSSNSTVTFAHTKKYWYELDPVSNNRKFIQNGSKQEKWIESTIQVPSGEDNDGEVTFTPTTIKTQEYVSDGTATGVKPVFEKECKSVNAYDETYFYNIIEWPTSVNLSRSVGGFQETSQTTTNNPAIVPSPPSAPDTSTETSITVVSDTVTANLSLDKVESELVDVPDTAIFYHGATDSNAIFFNYTTTTDQVVKIGDIIHGYTVTNVVNYIVDKALRKRTTDQSKKDKTPGWVILSNINNINLGDGVLGKGIPTGTTVTAIDTATKKITLSNSIKQKKKVRFVTFTSPATNKVNVSTLCYATLQSGTEPFIADTTYVAGPTTTGSGASIVVRAGKGITNRSAVVGMYFAKDKKLIEYQPLFYNKNTDCEQIITSEPESDYVVGTIILNDGTNLLSGQPLCINPKGNLNYMIDDVYWKYFGRPVDKAKLAYWNGKNKSESYTLEELENAIIEENKNLLNGKTVYKVIDDVCFNDIGKDYDLVYNPYKELSQAKNIISSVSNLTFDECVDVKSPAAYTAEELKNLISAGIQNSIASSSIVMPEEMYKKFVTNEDSLMNTLLKAIDVVEKSVPDKTQFPQLPPSIIGENKASIPLTTDKFRRLPPRYSKLEYLISDVTLLDDSSLTADTAANEVLIKIRSYPRYTGNASIGGQTGPDVSSKGIRVLTNKTNGYITSITTGVGTIPPAPPWLTAGWLSGGNLANQTSTPPSWISPDSVSPSDNNYPLVAAPYPPTVWEQGTNYQYEYEKTLAFRIDEMSNYLGESIENRGNGFIDDIKLARLSKNLSSTAIIIGVDSTAGFLSSGYLIIPKYIQKKKLSDTGNVDDYFYYLGEEIIYYASKTATSFVNCIRSQYGTNSTFEQVVSASNIEEGVDYIIKTLGNTDWSAIGAPSGYGVGTIFTATGISSGTGEVYTFESTMIPFESAPISNAVFSSYEQGYTIAQFWPYKLQG